MTKEELARELKQAALLEGEFTLRSGRKSRYYLDKYLFETQPALLRELSVRFAEFVTDHGLSWLHEIRQWLERELSGGGGSVDLRSSVGDRAARIRWRLADGRQLAVRLPNWSHELRKGFPITLVPEEATRRLLAHDTPSSDSLADRGV